MIEQSFAFGAGDRLIGTTCLPDEVANHRSGVGMILFNAGIVHRVGPHRINVRLARRLARRGIPSLRFDLAGQGDSERPPGDIPFEQQAIADIREALDCLAQRADVRRFALFGFCSGGNHGYHAAALDDRIAGLILYDTYFYSTLRSRLNRYLISIRRQGLFEATRKSVGQRLGQFKNRLASLWNANASGRLPAPAPFPTPSPSQLARHLKTLHERGTAIAVMYSEDYHRYNYADQFHEAFRPHGINDFVRADFFPGMDHVATEMAAQSLFMDRIEEWTVSLESSLCES